MEQQVKPSGLALAITVGTWPLRLPLVTACRDCPLGPGVFPCFLPALCYEMVAPLQGLLTPVSPLFMATHYPLPLCPLGGASSNHTWQACLHTC